MMPCLLVSLFLDHEPPSQHRPFKLAERLQSNPVHSGRLTQAIWQSQMVFASFCRPSSNPVLFSIVQVQADNKSSKFFQRLNYSNVDGETLHFSPHFSSPSFPSTPYIHFPSLPPLPLSFFPSSPSPPLRSSPLKSS